MLYTIIGGIIGLTVSYMYCRVTNTDCSNGYGPSPGGLLMIGGTILGAGIGLGIGVSALSRGSHLIQDLAKKIF